MKINGDTQKLLEEVRADDPAERIYALTALAMSDAPQVDRELVAGLADRERDCRATAARMLGEREVVHAVPALISALLDSSTDVAQEAADALGRIADTRAVEPLVQVLDSYAAPARASAARALGRLRDPAATAALAAALEDSTEAVRAEAAESLGELGVESAVDPLVAALSDPSDRVRQSALSALRRLGEPAIQALLAELRVSEAPRRWRAAWALGESAAASAATPLMRALRDESENVRAQAALALGSVGAKDALRPLREAAADPSAAVREAAALSLARLGETPKPAAARGDRHMGASREPVPSSAPIDTARVGVRSAGRAQPRSPRLVSLPLLLALLAVVIMLAAFVISEIVKAREAAKPSRVPVGPVKMNVTDRPGTGKGGVVSDRPPPGDGAAPQPDRQPPQSQAQCEVTRSGWFLDGDRLFVRGQVACSGEGVAFNVKVQVTVCDENEEIVAIEEGPVNPQRIAPGHSGDFVVSMPVPSLIEKPNVKVGVYWGDETGSDRPSADPTDASG